VLNPSGAVGCTKTEDDFHGNCPNAKDVFSEINPNIKPLKKEKKTSLFSVRSTYKMQNVIRKSANHYQSRVLVNKPNATNKWNCYYLYR